MTLYLESVAKSAVTSHAYHGGGSEEWRQTKHVLVRPEPAVRSDQFLSAVVMYYTDCLSWLELTISYVADKLFTSWEALE